MEMKALDEDGLLALRWADADLETGECLVVRSLQETPEGVGFKAPKTARGRRVVLLPRLAISALKAHRTNRDQERLRLGQGYAEQDFILARADGSAWPPSQFSSEFARLVKKRGIQCRFRDLRHSHASQLLRQGTPVRLVSERLGQSQTSTTMNVYAHTLPGAEREATDTGGGLGRGVRRSDSGKTGCVLSLY
jgi:integrase